MTTSNRKSGQVFNFKTHNPFEYLASAFLWQESIHPKISLALFLAGRLQLAAIIIWAQFYFTAIVKEQDYFTHFFHRIVEMVTDSEVITNSAISPGFDWKISFMCFYIILVMIVIGLLIISFKFKKNWERLETLYCFLGSIHNEVIYWYINIVCLRTLKSGDFSYNLFGMNIQTSSAANYVIIVLILTANIFFCGVSLIFRFDPFKTDNLMSCWVPSCQLVTGSVKTLQSIILIFLPRTMRTAILFWIVTLAAVSAQKWALHHQFPFYHRLGMTSAIILNSLTLVVAYTAALVTFFAGMEAVSQLFLLYIQTVLLVLAIKVGLKYYETQEYDAIANLETGVKCEEEVFKTMQILTKILENAKLTINSHGNFNSVDELYVCSIIKIHSKTCKKETCVCRALLKEDSINLSISEIKDGIKDITQELLFNFFKTAARKLMSHRVNIYLCYLELLRSKTGLRALITLFNIPRERTSFILRIGLDKLIRRLNENLNKLYKFSEEKYLNLSEFFEYQQLSSKLNEKIEEANEDFFSFWKLLCQTNIKNTQINKISQDFERKADDIDQLWLKLSTKFPKTHNSLSAVYAKYLLTIRNSQTKASSQLKFYNDWLLKSKSIKEGQEITPKNLLDPRNVALYVSMKNDKLGQILDSSCNAAEQFGYNRQDVIGKNINMLIPNCLQQFHNQALKKHIGDNPKDETLFTNISGFCKKKSGDVFPVQVYIGISPQFKEELIYVGLIREIISDKDYILLNSEGEIEGLSASLFKKLKITSSSNLKLSDLFFNNEEISQFLSSVKTQLHVKAPINETVTSISENFESKCFPACLKRANSNFKSDQLSMKISKVNALGTFYYSIELSSDRLTKVKLYGRSEKSVRSGSDQEGNEEDIDEGILRPQWPDEDFTMKNPKLVRPKTLANDHAKKVIQMSSITDSMDTYNRDLDELEEDLPNYKFKELMAKSTSTPSSKGKSKSLQAHLEKAVFEVPVNLSIKFLNILILLYGILTLVCLIIFSVLHISEISSIEADVKFSVYYESLGSRVTGLFFNTYQLETNMKNLVEPHRYSTTVSNEDFLLNALNHANSNLLMSSQDYYNYFVKNDPSQTNKFSIESEYNQKNTILSTQEFVKLLIVAGDRILKSPQYSLASQEDKDFILGNSFQCIDANFHTVQELISIIDQEHEFSNYILIIFLCLAVIFGVLTVGSFTFVEVDFEKKKRRLYESFTKFNLSHIDEIISDNSQTVLSALPKKVPSAFFLSQPKANSKEDPRKSKRVIIFSRDFNAIRRAIFLLFVTIVYIMGFSILMIHIDSSESYRTEENYIFQINMLMRIDITFQELTALTLQSVSGNDFTRFSQNEFESELEENYNRFIGLQLEIVNLINTDGIDTELKNLMTKNLCTLTKHPEICGLDSKYVKNGIYGYYGALTNDISELIRQGNNNNSNKTPTQYLLSTFAYMNFEKSMMGAFAAIREQIMSRNFDLLMESLQSQKVDMNTFWIVYCFLVAVIFVMTKFYLLNWMYISRTQIRKIIRLIPVRLIMANNFLKAYLRDNTQREYEHLFK